MKAQTHIFGSVALLVGAACLHTLASSTPEPEQSGPAWLSESLELCFLHIKSSREGKSRARKLEWRVLDQEYPRQLREDMNYTREIEGHGYFLNYNSESFGEYSRKACNIIKLPSRGARTLPEDSFAALNNSSDFNGQVVKFKACEQCLDDLAGHWSTEYLDQTWAISALSGANNDVTIKVTPIN